MDQTELISIITPVFNSEETLDQCVHSILAQSYKNFELILINDGSTDKSGSLCDKYALIDRRVKVFHTFNQGVSRARNHGINQVKGQWLCFIDSDDWVSPYYLEHLQSCLHKDISTQIVIGGAYYFDVKKQQVSKDYHFCSVVLEREEILKAFSQHQLIYFGFVCSKLYNVTLIKQNNLFFNPKIHHSEDMIFMLDYIFYCNRLTLTNYIDYYYRIGSNLSLSTKCLGFSSEYNCYIYLKNALDKIAENNEVGSDFRESEVTIKLYYLRRAIFEMYKDASLSRKERINILNHSIDYHETEIKKYWNTIYWIDKIGIYFLSNHLSRLYDSYMFSLFFIRKTMGSSWFRVRSLILRR
ncbi:MAG: glycosyltransferase family 2 protein [Bacteroidales bacterium]